MYHIIVAAWLLCCFPSSTSTGEAAELTGQYIVAVGDENINDQFYVLPVVHKSAKLKSGKQK